MRKHAVGATVLVSLEWRAESVVLTIDDSGGTPLTVGAGSGFGLAGMAERAATIGATLETESLHPGFSVRLTVPIGDPAEPPTRPSA